MTSMRSLSGFALLLASAVAALPASAAEPVPPPVQDTPAAAPAPVFVRPLDTQGHGAAPAAPAADPAAESGTSGIEAVVRTLKNLGMLSASALLMLIGSAFAGVLIAGLIALIRRRRERRIAT